MKTEAKIALMITPTSSSVTGSSRPRRCESSSTSATATSPPAKANACCETACGPEPSAVVIGVSAGIRHR
jgi:hypothetical protein